MTSCNHASSAAIALPSHEILSNGCSAIANNGTTVNDASCCESQVLTVEYLSLISETGYDVDALQSRCNSCEEYALLDSKLAHETVNGFAEIPCQQSACNGLAVSNDCLVENNMIDESEFSVDKQLNNAVLDDGKNEPSCTVTNDVGLTADEMSDVSHANGDQECIMKSLELHVVNNHASETCERITFDSQFLGAEPDILLHTTAVLDIAPETSETILSDSQLSVAEPDNTLHSTTEFHKVGDLASETSETLLSDSQLLVAEPDISLHTTAVLDIGSENSETILSDSKLSVAEPDNSLHLAAEFHIVNNLASEASETILSDSQLLVTEPDIPLHTTAVLDIASENSEAVLSDSQLSVAEPDNSLHLTAEFHIVNDLASEASEKILSDSQLLVAEPDNNLHSSTELHVVGDLASETSETEWSDSQLLVKEPDNPLHATTELHTRDNHSTESCEPISSDSRLLVAEPETLLSTKKTVAGMPLLNIPNSELLTYEKSSDFCMLPVSSPISDSRNSTLPPSNLNRQEVFTVQPSECSPDEFSDISHDKSGNVIHSEGSGDPNVLLVKESLASPIQNLKSVPVSLDDSIVQSILCDDDDDLKNDVGQVTVPLSPLKQKSVSFTSDAAGASFKIVPASSIDSTSLNSLETHMDNVDLESSGGFVEINLHSSGGSERFEQTTDSSQSLGVASKPSGFAGFLSRLSRKSDVGLVDSAPGWKLFGKVPPKEAPDKNPDDISVEFKAKVSQNSAKISPLHPKQTQPASEVNSGQLAKSLGDVDQTEMQPCTEENLVRHQEKEVIKSASRDLIRRSDREVPSTTALILEQRPGCLPSKSPEEALRHQQMYNEMVEAARKKEKKELKLRKKQRELQMKHEEQMSNALRVWNTQILPCWESAKGSKKAQELWWNGLPPSIRGKVWKLAMGNDLNVTAELYEICLVRAKEKLKILRDADSDSLSSMNESPGNRESSVELIKLDVSRTFPQLCIFQQGGPYHQVLQGLLGAYACYRPDVGYVQGMSFLAAVLLLNMDAVDTFICFANLLNKPCEVAFFRLDETLAPESVSLPIFCKSWLFCVDVSLNTNQYFNQPFNQMKAYFETYEMFFQENLPQLFAHFKALQLTPDIYIIDWMFTLFTKSLPLDVASRVWDVFCRDGEEFLFRTALGILRMYRDILVRLDFIHLAQFLTRLPDNISGTELFENIAQIRMVIEKQRFTQVLATLSKGSLKCSPL